MTTFYCFRKPAISLCSIVELLSIGTTKVSEMSSASSKLGSDKAERVVLRFSTNQRSKSLSNWSQIPGGLQCKQMSLQHCPSSTLGSLVFRGADRAPNGLLDGTERYYCGKICHNPGSNPKRSKTSPEQICQKSTNRGHKACLQQKGKGRVQLTGELMRVRACTQKNRAVWSFWILDLKAHRNTHRTVSTVQLAYRKPYAAYAFTPTGQRRLW